jgi:glycosyltransferase involved in cell wall biosynthesis
MDSYVGNDMGKKKNILFVRMLKSSFINKDLELLRNHFNVNVVNFNFNKTNTNGTRLTQLKLLKGILWADVTFSWFADFHAYQAVRLSKLFHKKSLVVIGGYEVAKVPELEYGAALSPESFTRVKYILENADLVLTVDDSLKNDALENYAVHGENIKTLPTGYDSNFFRPHGNKEKSVLTVCMGDNWNRVRIKGVDTFVNSAKFCPDLKFLVIGVQGEAQNKLKSFAPSNVEFIGPLSQDLLLHYYQKASVYCQLSLREGLPNALCEAMLCECIPVGTDVQGVRTAMGSTGFYVPYGDTEETSKAIKNALKSDRGNVARERIKTEFYIGRREKELVEMLQTLN